MIKEDCLIAMDLIMSDRIHATFQSVDQLAKGEDFKLKRDMVLEQLSDKHTSYRGSTVLIESCYLESIRM